MNTATINREWNFVAKETTSSNKGGTKKGRILFEFQILLSALSKSKNQKEKQILMFIYKKLKKHYKTIEK